jgi:hypothetical protein
MLASAPNLAHGVKVGAGQPHDKLDNGERIVHQGEQ